jgi:hypothetical protein
MTVNSAAYYSEEADESWPVTIPLPPDELSAGDTRISGVLLRL